MNTSDRKKERLAEALRENLRKRKIQQQARVKNNLMDEEGSKNPESSTETKDFLSK